MTGREHLQLYGRLKGVTELDAAVHDKLKNLGISEADADKLTSKYSGGMRRKISFGIGEIVRVRRL